MKTKVILFVMIFAALSALSLYAQGVMKVTNGNDVNQWVGKTVTQVMKYFGEPTYTSYSSRDRVKLDYIEEVQHVGPIQTYQFTINKSGIVSAANMSF